MRDSQRDIDVKNRLLDSVGEGEGGMIWENSIETCILSYVKQIASPGSMDEAGCSGLVHWDDPEGWDGEGDWRQVQDGGTPVHLWLILVNVWWKPPQYCKVTTQIKISKLIFFKNLHILFTLKLRLLKKKKKRMGREHKKLLIFLLTGRKKNDPKTNKQKISRE